MFATDVKMQQISKISSLVTTEKDKDSIFLSKSTVKQ